MLTFLGAVLAMTPLPSGVDGAWTRAWTASMLKASDKDGNAVRNATIRAAVRVGVAGAGLRLRLSNELGSTPVRIGHASIKSASGRVVDVTFGGGSATALLAEGAPLVSDPVLLPIRSSEVIEVSLYLPDATALETMHLAGGAPTRVSGEGDHTGDLDFATAREMAARPFIAGIDVLL